MTETFQLYVKPTSNCEGLPLQTFERLSPEWSGERVTLSIGEEGDARPLEVVGWTDLFTGRPCEVHVARVRWLPHERPDISAGPTEPQEGYLVWGGNSGVRILDDEAEPTPGVDDHLPPGHGSPIVWVALEDVADLTLEVRDAVTRSLCEGCGAELSLSASPYYLDEGKSIWLCEKCANTDYPDVDPTGLKVFDCPTCGTCNTAIEDDVGFH